MKNKNADLILTITAIVAFLAIGACWQVYRYKECKKVGFSTVYCIFGNIK